MNELLPYSNLTDEELLRAVYVKQPPCSDLELELAARLEAALDELSRPVRTLEDVLRSVEAAHGVGAGG